MVKRFKKIAKEAEGVAMDSIASVKDNNLVSAVKDSAQQIWLAGLVAFAKAQEEGTKVFDVLVKEGSVLQKRTMKMTESKLGEVTGKVTSATGDLTKVATGTWDKLESVFEERVARSLNRLGVPTNGDIKALAKRVEELTAALKSMGAVVPAKKAAAKPAAVKKVVKAVKATAKKVAAKKAK